MISRTIFTAGVAGFALTIATLAPAAAQYANQSTPIERAQTQSLNQGAVEGQVVPQDAANYAAAQSDYDSAQQRYRQQLDEYNAKTRNYDEQRQRYNENLGSYRDQRDTYNDQAQTYSDRAEVYRDETAPTVGDESDTANLWTLDRFADPNYDLFNMPVVDVDGITVGHFRRVEMRDTGNRMVVITLNSMRTIALPIEDIFYDPDMAVVVAELTSNEIDRTPSGVFGP